MSDDEARARYRRALKYPKDGEHQNRETRWPMDDQGSVRPSTAIEQLEPEPVEVPNPITGEVVSLQDPPALARMVHDIGVHIGKLMELRKLAERALAYEAERQGTGTLHLGETKVTVTPPRLLWDVEALEEGLRGAGCPEDVLGELIKTTVERRVDAKRADRLARANDTYARIVAACQERAEGAPSVRVTRP